MRRRIYNENNVLSPSNTVVDIIISLLKSNEYVNYPHTSSTKNMFNGHRTTTILSTHFVANENKSLFFEIDESLLKNRTKRDNPILSILKESANTLQQITGYNCNVEQVGTEQFEIQMSQNTKSGSTHEIKFVFWYGLGGTTKVLFYGWESSMLIPDSHFTIDNGVLDL